MKDCTEKKRKRKKRTKGKFDLFNEGIQAMTNDLILSSRNLG
jgi:hypothetical protein